MICLEGVQVKSDFNRTHKCSVGVRLMGGQHEHSALSLQRGIKVVIILQSIMQLLSGILLLMQYSLVVTGCMHAQQKQGDVCDQCSGSMHREVPVPGAPAKLLRTPFQQVERQEVPWRAHPSAIPHPVPCKRCTQHSAANAHAM